MAEAQRIRELERLLMQETQRADAADAAARTLRSTTLQEYLEACHASLFSNLVIERNRRLQSKGSIPIPRHKWCPTKLKPWSGFFDSQRYVFSKLFDAFPVDLRVFESEAAVAAIGRRLAGRTIADEKRVETFVHLSVEDPIRMIVDELQRVDASRHAFTLGDGIVFENHPHVVSEMNEEVVATLQSAAPRSHGSIDMNQLRPDQICVYRADEDGSMRQSMVYICEYKPPHKLTAPQLRAALRDTFDIFAEVINRETIPDHKADPEGHFQYVAKKLTASAVTQTYHYMIEGGLEYGLLTTAEMIVFLRIDWDSPETLLFHLAEPGAETLAHAPTNSYLCTAVAQCLAFSLLALDSSARQQDDRQNATAKLTTWLEDFDTTLKSIPADERTPPDSSASYQPIDYAQIDRSPYPLRWERRKRSSDPPANILGTGGPREPPSDDDDAPAGPPDTPSPTEQRRTSRRSQRTMTHRTYGSGQGGGSGRGGGSVQDAEYCTQKCLLGLVRSGPLDMKCPNASLHPSRFDNRCHAEKRPPRACHTLDGAQFLNLLWKQLHRSLDDGIVPLDKGGARSVLFKVTLLSHSYTFVAKGTINAYIKHLQHEAAVYERLKACQGLYVPVFLGAIDLRTMSKTYYFAHRVYITHMTFLSWGGQSLAVEDSRTEQLEGKALQSLRAIHAAGVAHRDVRTPNILRDPKTDGLMIIDFERAFLFDPPRRPLGPAVPGKRNAQPEPAETTKQKPSEQRQARSAFAEEMSMVERIFRRRCDGITLLPIT